MDALLFIAAMMLGAHSPAKENVVEPASVTITVETAFSTGLNLQPAIPVTISAKEFGFILFVRDKLKVLPHARKNFQNLDITILGDQKKTFLFPHELRELLKRTEIIGGSRTQDLLWLLARFSAENFWTYEEVEINGRQYFKVQPNTSKPEFIATYSKHIESLPLVMTGILPN